MMEKDIQRLFDLAKDQAPQTSVKDVNAWVEKAAFTIGFLAALKVLLTKKMIMISTTFTLLTGIGIVVATQLSVSKPAIVSVKNKVQSYAQPKQANQSISPSTPSVTVLQEPQLANRVEINNMDNPKTELVESYELIPRSIDFKTRNTGFNLLSTKDVTTQAFTEIEANGFVNFKIVNGSEDKIEVNQTDSDKCEIQVEIKNGKLRLNSSAKNAIEELVVTVKELKKLELNGFCEAEMVGEFKTDRFELEINGFSKANLNCEANKIELEINGETEVKFSGNASELDAEINGFSNVFLDGNFKESELEINGKTKVVLNGNGTNTDVEINGESKLLANGFETQIADIEGNGSSDVDMKVVGSLSVHLTGKCVVKIDGKPAVVEQELVGGAKLKM